MKLFVVLLAGAIVIAAGVYFFILRPGAMDIEKDDTMMESEAMTDDGIMAQDKGGLKEENKVEMQFTVLREGTGTGAENGDVVTVHYTGWLEDDTKFDSSVDRGSPFSFTLGAGEVITGWEAGIKGMKEGEVRILRIPPELAYGAGGIPGAIPPNAMLIFQVEVLSIRKK